MLEFKLSSNYGSITHFFHFMYGVFFPLILNHLETNEKDYVLYGSIAPMNAIFELPFVITIIPNKYKPQNIKTLQPLDNIKTEFNNHFFTYNIFKKIRKFIKHNVPKYLKEIDYKKIILIERKTDERYKNVYYGNSEYKDVLKTSGDERRKIGNHNELVKRLKKEFKKDFKNVSLENTSIYYQYLLFHKANVIIANHGASLSNICFMKKNSNVIEIISNNKLNVEKEDEFKLIANSCKVNHQYIELENDFSNIDIDNMIEKIKQVY